MKGLICMRVLSCACSTDGNRLDVLAIPCHVSSVQQPFLLVLCLFVSPQDIYKMMELMLQNCVSTSVTTVPYVSVFSRTLCFSHPNIFDVYGLYQTDIPRRNIKLQIKYFSNVFMRYNTTSKRLHTDEGNFQYSLTVFWTNIKNMILYIMTRRPVAK